jgi:predicted amidohydrolase YtcJ
MGGPDLPRLRSDRAEVERATTLEPGALKIRLTDPTLPDFDDLGARIARAHAAGRAVAVHCVTRAELVLTVAVLAEVGALRGDRIEHAGVAPPEMVDAVRRLGVAVVTQPHFVRERGDAYLEDVDAVDRPWLYRCRAWLAAGVPLAAGTDAPFGHPDPWAAMRAAIDRRTSGGASIGPDEALDPEAALALFTSPAEAPGAGPRAIAPGRVADLCLLDRPWRQARERLTADDVRATVRAGRLLSTADGGHRLLTPDRDPDRGTAAPGLNAPRSPGAS